MLCSLCFLTLTAYSYYDMILIRNSSSSLVRESIPRVMNAQRAILDLERLKIYINTIEHSIEPEQAHNAYMDASTLLTETMFDEDDVAVLARNVLNKVKLMWQTRKELMTARYDMMRTWGYLALAIDRLERLDRQADAAVLQPDDFLGAMYLPNADVGAFAASSAVKQRYTAAVERCHKAAEHSALDASCNVVTTARRQMELHFAAFADAKEKLHQRTAEIEYMIRLMSSSYTQNEAVVISTELGYIRDITTDLTHYLLLIGVFAIMSALGLYIAVFHVVIEPLQQITAFINRFNHKLSVEGMVLPSTHVTEIHKITALLHRLFDDVKKMTSDSERITQRYSELLTLSYYDELTGAHNRRALELFNRTIEQVPPRCAVMMVDIDFFKKFNDTLGHQKGDMVLRRVSTCLIKNTAESDIVYRYGGEEFCIVLQDIDKDKLAAIGARLCQSVKQLDMLNPGNDNKPVTISIGISPVTQVSGEWTLEELIYKADRALYEAKSSGRERFVFYHENQEGLL